MYRLAAPPISVPLSLGQPSLLIPHVAGSRETLVLTILPARLQDYQAALMTIWKWPVSEEEYIYNER